MNKKNTVCLIFLGFFLCNCNNSSENQFLILSKFQDPIFESDPPKLGNFSNNSGLTYDLYIDDKLRKEIEDAEKLLLLPTISIKN